MDYNLDVLLRPYCATAAVAYSTTLATAAITAVAIVVVYSLAYNCYYPP
jgi:hypothetical protein